MSNGNKLIIPAVILGGGIILYVITRPGPQEKEVSPEPTPEPVPITTPEPKFTPIPISIPVNGQIIKLQLDRLQYRFIDPSRPPIPIEFTQIQPGNTISLLNSERSQMVNAYSGYFFCNDQKIFVRFLVQNLSSMPQNVKLSIIARSFVRRIIDKGYGIPSQRADKEVVVNIGETETTINGAETKAFEFCGQFYCMKEREGLKSGDELVSRNAGEGDILLTLEVAGQKALDKYVLLKWKYVTMATAGIRLLRKC